MIEFWKKDIINKMIVLASLLLMAGIFIIVEMIVNMPTGKSLKGMLSEILPANTPTLAPPTPTSTKVTASALLSLPTFSSSPTMIQITATETVIEPPTAITIATTTEEISTVTPESLSASCIPNKSSQTGRVVEVLDGVTIRVLMNGLVYVVRYIGVENPAGKFQFENASILNSNLVYGRDVELIADKTDKDANGRLLRYVLAGDTFVNLELLQKGAVIIAQSDASTDCDVTFESAEHAASSAALGIWAIASPTPSP